MVSYQGYCCPVCKERFLQTDDIVVCPDCGAPHHRACWNQQTHCFFEERHEEAEVWKKETAVEPEPLPPNDGKNTADFYGKPCPVCGKRNDKNAAFCKYCSHAFFPEVPPVPAGQSGFNQRSMPVDEIVLNPLAGVEPSDVIEGVPAGDLAKYIGTNSSYYIPVFQKIARTHKSSRFHFSAFLFNGLWMLFRKQYKLGALVLSISVLVRAVMVYIDYNFTAKIAERILLAAGMDIHNPLLATMSQQMSVIDGLLSLSLGDKILFFLPTALELMLLVFSIVIGVKANKWYLHHCLSKVRQINRQSENAKQFNALLKAHGGVNYPLSICLTVCVLIINEYLYQFLPLIFS